MSKMNQLGTVALVSSIAILSLSLFGCCKGDKKEEAKPTPVTSATAVAASSATAAPVETAATPNWKTKCPDADRPMGGTVTTLRVLKITEKPDSTSKKLSTINPGTWVNLLGAKGNWYCIDYPCGEGKLCPGWIMSRYSKLRVPRHQDAGAKKDAATKKDAGRRRIGILPKLKFKIPKKK